MNGPRVRPGERHRPRHLVELAILLPDDLEHLHLHVIQMPRQSVAVTSEPDSMPRMLEPHYYWPKLPSAGKIPVLLPLPSIRIIGEKIVRINIPISP